MSLLERIGADGAEEVEQGKRLIRAGDDRRASLAGRMGLTLHRLSVRTRLGGMRLRGRAPLRLLAVPKDPVAGDKAAGEALMGGQIVFGREKMALADLNFARPDLTPEFSDYLQSFAWLRDLAAAVTRERGARLAERIAKDWLALYADHAGERAWRPDLWGRRILFWSAYAPYILSSQDAAYRAALLKTLARGARFLERSADKAPSGLARVAAWAGLTASALVVQGGSVRLGQAEGGLSRALAAALHDDNGLVSRSPIDQLQLVELLGQLRAVYYAGRRDMPEELSDILAGATAALLAATLGDGALSSWQGGNMVGKHRVAAAVEASAAEARPLRQARGWGYQRLAAKKTALVLDAAPPPTSRALNGGCASTLAFELSDGDHRLVVNCGGAGFHRGAPAKLLQLLRTTAAHSTLTLGDRNSTAILEDGTLGRGASQVEIEREEVDADSRVTASHDGYVRRFGLVHRRQIELSGDGAEVRGQDLLVRQGRKRLRDPLPFAVRFHLAPAVEVTSTADGQGALLRIRGGGVWQFRCRGGKLAIEESLWIDALGRPLAASQLVISGETPPTGMSISWLLRRG